MPEYLDPEIAAEGQRADDWQPFQEPPRIPDYKGIKTIAKYFPQHSGRPYRHQPFPAYLYHRTEPPRLVQNAEQAAALGVEWKADQYGELRWHCSGEWQHRPVGLAKFDPKAPGAGKNVVVPGQGSQAAQSEMIAAVVAAVTAQMAKGASAPAATDPDYLEFQAFKAWKAQQAKVGTEEGGAPAAPANALKPLSPDEEKAVLVDLADEKGVKIDKRWSLDRIKAELDKIGDDKVAA